MFDCESLFSNEMERAYFNDISVQLKSRRLKHIHTTISWLSHEATDDCIFSDHNLQTKNYVFTDNRDLETQQSRENVLVLKKSSKHDSVSGSTSRVENKTRRRMNKQRGPPFLDERRARYAANWIRANRMFNETYDNLDNPMTMENNSTLEERQDLVERSVEQDSGSLKGGEGGAGHDSNTRLELSSSSSDIELVLEDSEVDTQRVSKSSSEAEENVDENLNNSKDLEDENCILRTRLILLEQELEESKNQTSQANARVCALVSDLATANRQLTDQTTIRKRNSITKKAISLKSQNSVQTGLSRQQSTYSEYCEGASKKSLLSNISGGVSNKSSFKSVASRTSSNAASQQPDHKRTQSLPKTDEFEAERLAFAEKLVEKEEIITSLQKQVNFSTMQLRQLEAGIDGLETRFVREITVCKTEAAKRYQMMFEKGAGLISEGTLSEKAFIDLKQEFLKLAGSLESEVRNLEKELTDKGKMLEEAEENSTRLIHELEEKKVESDAKTSRVDYLEGLLAEVKGELAELKSQDQENRGHLEEMRLLNDRVSGLEVGLAEYESQNQDLFRKLELAQEQLVITEADHAEQIELLNKDNTTLKLELTDMHEKLTDCEQELTALKKEANDYLEKVAQNVQFEEQIQSLEKANQELELHLTRRKRHIDELQGDLKELKLTVLNQERDQGFGSCIPNDIVSSQVDAVIQAEQRYSELEQILTSVQDERDKLVQEITAKEKAMRLLMKENKNLMSSLTRQQKENSKLSNSVEAMKAEIADLRSGIKIGHSSRDANTGIAGKDPDIDIMQELVSSKVALAEMDEKLIKVRKELHAAFAKNIMLTARLSRLEGALEKPKTGSLRMRFTFKRKNTFTNRNDIQ